MLRMLYSVLLFGLFLLWPTAQTLPARNQLPNILWITSEDHGPHMGCYGDSFATTPNVDALAAKGMLYTHAWSNAPVCAPARTTLISGMYPPLTGSENMRSLVAYPRGKQMFPQLLRGAGYYATNNAKEDYNLEQPGQVWDESSRKAHWKNRAPGQPFFAVFNSERSHESQVRVRPHKQIHDPAKVRVPAYHPDTPEVRQDWAQYYDVVSEVDAVAGERLKELADAGLAEDTIVFYFADHGAGMPRSKRWPYNSGLQMPLVVYFPEKFKQLAPPEYKAGGKSDRLVSFVDFAPTVLSLAGLKPPDWMQGHAFMGKYTVERQPFIYGFRGRMDERYDLVRSVTDGRYVYIRNFMPHLPYGQYINYMFQTPTTSVWKRLYDEGKLKPPQTYFWEPKPSEELYDLQSDPDEVRNLATSSKHSAVLIRLREAQRALALKVRDVGFLPESEMHRRAQSSASIYDFAQDAKLYPVERVIAMAGKASSTVRAEWLRDIHRGLRDQDSGVRYWAVMGLLIQGKIEVLNDRDALRTLLKDEAPAVRIAAARALGLYGNAEELQVSLATLREFCAPERAGRYAAIEALNAIDALGKKAAPLAGELKTLQQQLGKTAPAAASAGAALNQRTGEYPLRLLEHILGQL